MSGMRIHGTRVVGKTSQARNFKPSRRALCVLATADLNGVADRDLLSLLARGFSEAAENQDRDAWLSWLWSHGSQGRVRPEYVKKLGAKVLGPRARRFRGSPTPALKLFRWTTGGQGLADRRRALVC